MKNPWPFDGVHLLIDPDNWDGDQLATLFSQVPSSVRSVIVGGTYTHSDRFECTMESCLSSGLPVGNIIGAGSIDSVLSPRAAFVILPILFGATSTRFVLDHIIQVAPAIRRNNQTAVAVAYFVLAGNGGGSAAFFTQAWPIPRLKLELLTTLSLAAMYLGVQGIYLEAGSGASFPVTVEEVAAVREVTSLPILVGGGIDSVERCQLLFRSGAQGIVIGSALENKRSLTWLSSL